MNKFPADVVRRFNAPSDALYRAFDHLIGAKKGMTLLVPIVASTGKLGDLVDKCPVPLLEITAILEADYATAAPLDLANMLAAPFWQQIRRFEPLAVFSRQLLDSFTGDDGIHVHDADWRQAQIHLAAGGEPCRVLIGASGVRFAFTPDFFEGML